MALLEVRDRPVGRFVGNAGVIEHPTTGVHTERTFFGGIRWDLACKELLSEKECGSGEGGRSSDGRLAKMDGLRCETICGTKRRNIRTCMKPILIHIQ